MNSILKTRTQGETPLANRYRQSAVIPYRTGVDGIEILVITTSSGKKWTIPKGHIEKKMKASESAAKEAYEEAGIKGVVQRPSVGSYSYEKFGQEFQVKVFLMKVTQELSTWPEMDFRQRKWKSWSKAAKKMRHKDLKRLFMDLESRISDLIQL